MSRGFLLALAVLAAGCAGSHHQLPPVERRSVPPRPPALLPSNDADEDRIANVVDSCPRQPEDMDGFQDEDGCPDLDNNVDGVPDLRDACPLEPGGPASGCPVMDPDATPR